MCLWSRHMGTLGCHAWQCHLWGLRHRTLFQDIYPETPFHPQHCIALMPSEKWYGDGSIIGRFYYSFLSLISPFDQVPGACGMLVPSPSPGQVTEPRYDTPVPPSLFAFSSWWQRLFHTTHWPFCIYPAFSLLGKLHTLHYPITHREMHTLNHPGLVLKVQEKGLDCNTPFSHKHSLSIWQKLFITVDSKIFVTSQKQNPDAGFSSIF